MPAKPKDIKAIAEWAIQYFANQGFECPGKRKSPNVLVYRDKTMPIAVEIGRRSPINPPAYRVYGPKIGVWSGNLNGVHGMNVGKPTMERAPDEISPENWAKHFPEFLEA
jgi:hypothetical protein